VYESTTGWLSSKNSDQKLGVPTAAEGFEGEVGQDFTERHCVGAGQPRVTMRPFGRDVVAVEAAMVV